MLCCNFCFRFGSHCKRITHTPRVSTVSGNETLCLSDCLHDISINIFTVILVAIFADFPHFASVCVYIHIES